MSTFGCGDVSRHFRADSPHPYFAVNQRRSGSFFGMSDSVRDTTTTTTINDMGLALGNWDDNLDVDWEFTPSGWRRATTSSTIGGTAVAAAATATVVPAIHRGRRSIDSKISVLDIGPSLLKHTKKTSTSTNCGRERLAN